MILNNLMARPLGDLRYVEYSSIAIDPRSILTQSASTWLGSIYRSIKTNYVCKQMTDVKLRLLQSNTWNHFTMFKIELWLV